MLKNAPNNLKLTSPDIQRDIINSATVEITKAIITDLRDDLCPILVDECRDVSVKEQMGVVIWYVNGFGCVIERFISLVHIQNTSVTSLKKGIESLLSTYGLSISSLRGQGHDGATNMRVALIKLESQLENFVFDMRMDKKFSEVSGIGGLAENMVATRKHIAFPLVYLLVKLSLILPIATATMERAFSAMNIIKSSLLNRMGDELLNDCLVTYIERDVFANINNEVIVNRFQLMKNRQRLL
ncbi:uncharacterized protein LOC131180596 [Hevea brasiliensis]|uniref:uncharacterized protein LOC131180596 n=1 Tax=Hevea brasiliensis TaxID=3981 RepID=UPI0025DE7479|nr:uncharacterized protein LOC131180596 [Hevea brasiliensis]